MRSFPCYQGSAEWLDLRVGRITASRVVEALSKYQDKKRSQERTAEWRTYFLDLVIERLTGRSTENFISPEMIWGSDHESEARLAYEEATGELTERAGFILHPEWNWAGASPDALVGEEGGLEIKCPKSTTHYKWRGLGVVPPEHEPQVMWNMACSGRQWWDFASYDPRMPRKMRLFIVRVHRNDERIAEIAEAARVMHEAVESTIAAEGLPATPFLLPTLSLPESAPPIDDWAAAFEAITAQEGMTP